MHSGVHVLLGATSFLFLLSGCSLRLDTDGFRTPLPSRAEIRLVPTEATTVDDLVVEFETQSTDPLGQPIDYIYEWTRDDEGVEISANHVSFRQTSRDEVWRVKVTPFAGIDARAGEPSEAQVTIRNTAPVIQTIGFSSYEPHKNQTIHTFAKVIDPDDEASSLAYRWLRNGEEIDGATSGRVDLTSIPDLAVGDELQLHMQATDSEPGPSSASAAITVQADELRWRQLLPDRNAPTGRFWDPLHQRLLMLVESQDSQAEPPDRWEFAVDSGTGRGRYVKLPDSLDDSDAPAGGRVVYDPVHRRGILVTVDGEGATDVWTLDLEDRARPKWEQLEAEGLAPPGRVVSALIFDETKQLLWRIGGVADGVFHDDIWVLELSATPKPRWRASQRSLPAFIALQTVVQIPGEQRAFLFGGADQADELTPTNRVFEARFTDGEISFEEARPLEVAVVGAFAVFVPDLEDPTYDRIYVGSGVTSFLEPVDKIWIFDPNDTDAALAEVEGLSEYPRSEAVFGPAVSVHDATTGRILIESLSNSGDFSRPSRGVWALRPSRQDETYTGVWEPLSRYGVDLPPALAFAVDLGDGSFGGGTRGLDHPAEPFVWNHDPILGQLHRAELDAGGPPPRAAAGFSPAGLMFGGVDGWPGLSSLQESSLWERSGTTWVSRAVSPPLSERWGHAMFSCGPSEVYFGGQRSSFARRRDAGMISCAGDPCTHQEDITPDGTRPTARAYATAMQIRDEEAVVFGGRVNMGGTSELWRFRCPANGEPSWESLSPTGPPSERYGHTMTAIAPAGFLVTHSSLVVGGDLSKDGTDMWRLDVLPWPGFNWTELLPRGPPPAPRRHHVAWWDSRTDQLMIYGGERADSTTVAFSDWWALRIPGG